MHWADFTAQRLAQQGDRHIIATGITPSGHIHVGNMREVLTGDMLRRACEDAGLVAEMVYIADSADPLRKVYDFLDDSYAQYIGHPLGDIPAPDENGRPQGDGSYSQYFLEPFLLALEETGVKARLIDNLQAYNDGHYAENARTICDDPAKVKEIIERVSGRELPSGWFPYNPKGSDGSMDGVKVTSYEWPYIQWTDSLGESGVCDLRKGDGKLPWRIDWPAKWQWIGVTCEPFGKDHSVAGSSYDTGKEICRLLGREAPMAVPYEWISLKGEGAMSGSKGVGLNASQLLEIVPPEVMRYLIARSKPKRAIQFDPGEGLIALADEFERLSSQITVLKQQAADDDQISKRKRTQLAESLASYRLSLVDESVTESAGVSVSFSHLSLLAQVKADDAEVWLSLANSHGLDAGAVSASLVDRLGRMRNWVRGDYFPQSAKLTIRHSAEQSWCDDLDADAIDFLTRLHSTVKAKKFDEAEINNWIRSAANDSELPLSEAFRILYQLYLGKQKGPKLAAMLAALSGQQVLSPLNSAISLLG